MTEETVFALPPTELVRVRQLSHAAVQWPSRAARANLKPRADDSHSNLGWSEGEHALVSHPLDVDQRRQLGFSFRSHSLLWMADNMVVDSLDLAGAGQYEIRDWCDQLLSGVDLQTTDQAAMPYELDAADFTGFADANAAAELATLGAWYARANSVLTTLVERFHDIAVSPPDVRCWPHHYDLAALFVLDGGDPETARSIGVGLSPGDESYAEPYFYCTPWPTPVQLPEAPDPLYWHTVGFTSLVWVASRIDESTDLEKVLAMAIECARETLN